MGRLPKPTKVLELEKGKLYDKQAARSALEPKPKKDLIPRCPKRFNPKERRAWKDLAAVLKNFGLFTAANSLQLQMLASTWVQYVSCCEELAKHPKIVSPMRRGKASYNQYFLAQQKLIGTIDKLSANLGLSSIALAKIGGLMLKSKREKDDMEGLLD